MIDICLQVTVIMIDLSRMILPCGFEVIDIKIHREERAYSNLLRMTRSTAFLACASACFSHLPVPVPRGPLSLRAAACSDKVVKCQM